MGNKGALSSAEIRRLKELLASETYEGKPKMDAKIGAVHVGAIRGDLYRFATYPGAAVGPAGAREFRFLVVGEFGRDQVEQFRRMALGTRRGIVTRVPVVVHVDGEPVRYCAGAYIAATRTTGKLGGTATVDLAFVAHEPLAVVTRATWRTRLAAWIRSIRAI